jgi:glyoxylase-like metal-dependent hydrolase (beta-lactamase superfamily II)
MTKNLNRTLLAALLAATIGAAPAFAAAPMVKTPAPGFYRMMLGDFEITALNDGTLDLPVDKLLTNTTPAAVGKALAEVHQKSPVETSANAYLVNTGSKLVLVDTGAGVLYGPTLGRLLANLKAAGYRPDQVDEVYLTHMHGDHVGGLLAGGKPAFPNAVVRADKREAGQWLSKGNMDKAPAGAKDTFKGAMGAVDPYAAAGKFKPFEGDVDLVPGVKAHPAPGHTPGHTVYVVESRGQRLVLMGDLIHVAAVQFPDPSVTISFDSDSKAAAAARKQEFSDAAKAGDMLGGAHLQFPGLGYLRAEGKGYRWIPVNYTQMR